MLLPKSDFRGMTANLLVLVALKVIYEYTWFLYYNYDSNRFHVVNNTCRLLDTADMANVHYNGLMRILSAGFVFAAVGGLVANKWLGVRRVLIIGGAVMSLAVGLMTISIRFGQVCQQGFYVIVWLLHPLYMGLVAPCLFYGFAGWAKSARSRMLLVLLYFLCAHIAALFRLLIAPLVFEHLHNRSFETACGMGIFLSIMFTCLAAALLRDEEMPDFEPPTLHRLIRYFKVLTIFTLLALKMNDDHVSEYWRAIWLFSNSSHLSTSELTMLTAIESVNVPRWVFFAGQLSSLPALALIGTIGTRSSRLSCPQLRIQVGTGAAAVVSLACCALELVLTRHGPCSPAQAVLLYCTAAFIMGAASIVTFGAMYEFVLLISARSHALLTAGIAFSIWSLSSFVRLGLHIFMFERVLPALVTNQGYLFCTAHAIGFILLAVGFIYCRYISFPLAFTLAQEPEDGPCEMVPLVASNEISS